MRQILFRAKRKDNGEWVEGCYIHCAVSDKDFILPKGSCVNESQLISEEGCLRIFCFEVISETVSQHTSLTDKNGNRIWENAIVKTKFFGKDDGKGHNFSNYDEFVVKWNNCGFVLENDNRRFNLYSENKTFEVIGNVFDNPDLLEVQV